MIPVCLIMKVEAKLIKKKFKTNDTSVRFHKDDENLMQMIYQIISAYFEDDCADELTLDPVFNAILEKNSLASQPTLSRFFNRMDEDTLLQFDDIDKSFRDIIYSIKCPEHMLLDLDSTLFGTYGNQEGEGFNFHYQSLWKRTDVSLVLNFFLISLVKPIFAANSFIRRSPASEDKSPPSKFILICLLLFSVKVFKISIERPFLRYLFGFDT